MRDPKVKVGSLWRDNDPRHASSRIGRVNRIDGAYVWIEWGYRQRDTMARRVKLSRFNGRSNGYSLVEDVT